MIVDASAVVAILLGEPERDRFVALIAVRGAEMSAASYVEIGLVIDRRRNPTLTRQLDVLLEQLRVSIADVTAAQAKVARRAHQDFGRGSGHPARLNYGACFSYALAVDRDEPLLFKGNDFGHTDVQVADREDVARGHG